MSAKIYAFPCSRRALDVADMVATEAKAAKRYDAISRKEALTRARLIQEAIDEAIVTGAPCDYESIMVTVAEYERSVQ